MTAFKVFEDVYAQYKAAKTIIGLSKSRVLANPQDRYIATLDLPSALTAASPKKQLNMLSDFWDGLEKRLNDQFIIALTGEFEKLMFARIGHAAGDFRKDVSAAEGDSHRLRSFSVRFIKDGEDFFNLSGLRKLLAAGLPEELIKGLQSLAEHRDYVAYGKRWEPPTVPLTVEAAFQIVTGIFQHLHRHDV